MPQWCRSTERKRRLSFGAFSIALAICVVSTGVILASIGTAVATSPVPIWMQDNPVTSPPSRYLANTAYDPATGNMVLFGGESASGPLNDTWVWNGTTWTAENAATSPTGRYFADMAYDPATGNMVLFGGESASGPLNDTWVWNGSTWAQEHPATSPPVREFAAMAYDPATGNMLLFAGYSPITGVLGDTWQWNGTTWTEESPSTNPAIRYGASMAYDPASGNMVLFGGENNGGFLGDTWTWDGTNWNMLTPQTSPSARYDASMAFDPATGNIVIFGGSNGHYLGDTWTWNGANWNDENPVNSAPARDDASMAFDQRTGKMVLFGGYDGDTLNDTWSWSFEESVTQDWSELSPATNPSLRGGASIAYDPGTGQLVLFGGNHGTFLNDTWTWVDQDWVEQEPSTSPPARIDASFAYDAATGQLLLFGGTANGISGLSDTWDWTGTNWTPLHPSTSPPARYGASMAYDPGTGQLVLFGGYGNANLGDTWTWNGANWVKQSPSTSPSARVYPAVAYDSGTGQLLLFGGYGSTSLNDTWAWDGTNWDEQPTGTMPPIRWNAAMAFDAGTGQLVLYGGNGGTSLSSVLGDTWTWNGSNWSELTLLNSPPALFDASMTYDPGTGQLVLFGGYGNNSTVFNNTWSYGPVATVPGAPTILNAAAGNASATVNFDKPASDGGSPITNYTVTATDVTNPSDGGQTASGGSSPITVAGLTNGDTYTLTVTAANSAGSGPPSEPSSPVTPSLPAVTVTVTGTQTYGSSSPSFSFTDDSPGVNLSGTVSCATVDGGTQISSGLGAGSHTIDSSSCSGLSNPNYAITFVGGAYPVGQEPINVTVTGSQTYGSSNGAFTATPPAGITLNGSVSCTAIENAATMPSPTLAAGSYTIEGTSCSIPDNSNYAITFVGGAYTVEPAPLTITASSGQITYGDAVPDIVAGDSGFLNGDSATSLTTQPSCGDGLSSPVPPASTPPAGTYSTSCSGAADPNYLISYLQGSLSVLPAALTITASSAQMTYGAAVPAVTASYSGFVNGDSAASLTTLPTCGTSATSSSPVGSYSTSCNMTEFTSGSTSGVSGTTCAGSVSSLSANSCGATDPNYQISYVDGTLEVDPASLTITASSPSSTYGATVPEVTASYSGFENDDSAFSLTSQPVCSTSASSSSPAGTYDTSCSGAVDPNYTISYVGGTATIGQAALVITASSPAMSYGGSVPSVTPSYSGFVNGDSAASLAAQPTCSTGATSPSPSGSYPTSCTGAVDNNYVISYDGGTLTVGNAVLVITASSSSSTYGGTVPTVTPSYSGFVNGEGPTSLTTQPTCISGASSSSGVGSYTTSCSGASDSNYTITYVQGKTTVGPAPLVITASSSSSTYGGTVPAVTPSYSGFVNSDGTTSLTSPPTCNSAASSSSPVGSYTTFCSGASDPNYTISYAQGTTVVGPAPLVVTASSGQMTSGSTVPAITASYSGFVNGDTAASLMTAPSCTTSATSSSPPGTYATACQGAADANYTISYVAGTITVLPARSAGGTFVISDLSAGRLTSGTAVQFWGSQWAKSNALSGGMAPASFKGFEDSPAVAACHASWTTDPGNSTPPPPSVATYMVMIVAGTITQSGSVISGDTLHLVVVKVNPGYSGDPGHVGTGTIISVLC
jgi:hypothetical protein